ncbi:MAG: hypothetical protein OD918_01135 [Gammaproteobacteria bacterium]
MRQSNKINPNYLDDLIFTSDGGVELNMKTFLKRPSVQEKIRKLDRIADLAIAKRRERLQREQSAKSAK